MTKPPHISQEQEQRIRSYMKMFDRWAVVFLCLFIFLFLYVYGFLPSIEFSSQEGEKKEQVPSPEELEFNKIENGVHVRSGLVADENYELVLNNCGSCHSYKLVTQNRNDAAGWQEVIDWMQETQKLWDLGENEEKIIAYLAKNYGAKKQTRRENIKVEEWYVLE